MSKKTPTLLKGLADKGLKTVHISSGSTTSGTISILDINIQYNDSVAFVNGRCILSGVAANVRPTVTINVPSDIPSAGICGAMTLRGNAGSMQVSDPPNLTHVKGETKAYLNLYNTVAQASAGYVEEIF